MTPAEINVAIAQWCGWKGPEHPDVLDQIKGWTSETWKTWVLDPHGQLVSVNRIPPYTTSLDAIAQAEAGLTDHEYECYRIELWDLVTGGEKPRHNEACPTRFERAFLSATSLQRSTALLHTVGLWKEEA